LRRELVALRKLIDLEQLGRWELAAPPCLVVELHSGKPTPKQRRTYSVLQEAWRDGLWSREFQLSEEQVPTIEQSLANLGLKHASDKRHLATAIALNASWFLTNDKEVIRKSGEAYKA